MAENPETRLTRRIMADLKSIGCYVVKYPGGATGTTGTPDIIGCYKSVMFGIEVKLPYPSRHDVSRIQAKRIRQIREAGGIAGVACSVDEARAVLDGRYEDCQREHEVLKKEGI